MTKTVEILVYTLKPKTGDAFYSIMKDISVPLHLKNGIDVVWHGQSQHCPDSYFLIRSFPDLDSLQRTQDTFYASDAWRTGPRNEIVTKIDKSIKVVVTVSNASIEAIRENGYAL